MALVGAAALVAACGDDAPTSPGLTVAGAGGTSGGSGGASGSTAGGTAGAGTAGTAGGAGGGGTGGAGGATAGSAGTAGTSAGTAGTGGGAPAIVPAVFLIDNIRLRPKVEGGGGEGGASGGAGAGGDATGGAPEAPAPLAAGAGGASGGAGNEGGAGPGVLPDFLETFEATLGLLSIHPQGFSPSPGGSGGPRIIDDTKLVWEAGTGHPGGAAKATIPFSVPTQQTDFAGAFATPQDLTGYELLADVKMIATGDAGACASAWMYVYGASGGYANDKSGEPMMGQTSHLVKDEWTTVRLNLDGPYGYHSSTAFPNFEPTAVDIWGVQINTWGCP